MGTMQKVEVFVRTRNFIAWIPVGMPSTYFSSIPTPTTLCVATDTAAAAALSATAGFFIPGGRPKYLADIAVFASAISDCSDFDKPEKSFTSDAINWILLRFVQRYRI